MSRQQQSILVILGLLCLVVFVLAFLVGSLDSATVVHVLSTRVDILPTHGTKSTTPYAATSAVTPAVLSPTPTWLSSPTPTSTPTAADPTYIVQSGDTLTAIADHFGIPLAALIAANPTVTPDLLHPGQVIRIPGNASLTQIALAVPSALPTKTNRQPTEPSLLTVTPAATLVSVHYPFISGISGHARQIFLYGQMLGNRAGVFSKVGDSITVGFNYITRDPAFLYPIGKGHYNLEAYTDLQPTVNFFLPAVARDSNSFTNTSMAAKGGWSAWSVIDPQMTNVNCNSGETPLECEFRLVKPSVALVMLGTNDVQTTPPDVYEGHLRQVIETSIRMGVIPVMSTIPALHRDWASGRVEPLNQIIRKLTHEYDVPLWDYAGALQGLPNDGLSFDGVHPSVPPNGRSADFTPENLQYGYTVRNLTALQALDAIWRSVLQP